MYICMQPSERTSCCVPAERNVPCSGFLFFLRAFTLPFPRRISKISIKAARAAASSSRRPTGPTGQGQAERADRFFWSATIRWRLV